MPGLFGTLYTANSGLRTQQKAIETTSHNIANANTPGYTRQRTVTSATSPYTNPSYTNSIGAGQIGTGVEVTDIERIRSTFYDFQYRSESHEYGKHQVKYEYYKNVENIFNEPSDSGISSSINRFFTSWQEIGKDPNSTSAKNLVIENGRYLADSISETYKSLDDLKNTTTKEIERITNDISNILVEIDELDKNINIVQGAGKTPNDYLDKKDKLLDDLSSKLNIQDNDIKDTLDAAVNGSKKDGKIDLKELNTKIAAFIKEPGKELSGEIQGYKDIQTEIEDIMLDLKEFAEDMSGKINKIYDPTEAKEFFITSGADWIIKINPELINDIGKLDVTSETANDISKLRDAKIGTDPTLRNQYNGILENIGLKSQEAIRNEENQRRLLNNIDTSRNGISGVSIDEEMVNLIQLQHSYGANAKVLSTLDSLLDIIINGIIR